MNLHYFSVVTLQVHVALHSDVCDERMWFCCEITSDRKGAVCATCRQPWQELICRKSQINSVMRQKATIQGAKNWGNIAVTFASFAPPSLRLPPLFPPFTLPASLLFPSSLKAAFYFVLFLRNWPYVLNRVMKNFHLHCSLMLKKLNCSKNVSKPISFLRGVTPIYSPCSHPLPSPHLLFFLFLSLSSQSP